MPRRTLLRGGTVLTSRRTGEVLDGADVLLDGEWIAGVGHDLDAGDAEVLDVRGRIVMPGFVDTHRHTWQSVVRNVAADWSLAQYMTGLHTGLSRHFRAEDTYAGNLLGALEALDAGITTMVDWSHNLGTPEHADGAIAGLRDSGIRAVFAHGGGAAQWGGPMPSTVPHPVDAARIRRDVLSSDDGLVTMAIALRGPQFVTPEINRADFALADDLDLRITMHVGDGFYGRSGPIHQLRRDGLLSDRTTYIHCCTLGDDELDLIGSTGGSASVAPDVEMQMGHGFPATGRLIKAGVRPTFSIDVCSSTGGDMFGVMRTAIGMQRALDNAPLVETGEVIETIPLTCADVLMHATIDGAEAAGLGRVTGSLESGKAADVLALDGDALSMIPMNNPLGSIVYAAHPGLVRDVWVAGRRVKKDGRLCNIDRSRIREMAETSRDHIFSSMPGAATGGAWDPGVAL